MSDTDPYEREAAKAAIKVLQREIAEVRELLIKCLSVMPVGYIPTHTVENLPEMIGDVAKALAEETTECEQLECELAEAREQRDTLAEALEECKGWTHRAVELEVSVPKALAQAQSIVKAESALAAVKGELK